MKIADSGNRTEFASGAVRDIQEGKGRCDLLPLDVVGLIYDVVDFINEDGENQQYIADVFKSVDLFTKTCDDLYLINALVAFVNFSEFTTFSDMFLGVAKHFEEGAKKYGERNWEKGIPVSRYIDSAIRHFLKYLRGDKDEPHDRAFCWNILCAIWTCNHKPELNEYGKECAK